MKPLPLPAILLILSLFPAPPHARANHLLGGQMTYEDLGGGQFRFHLILYRDCSSGGATFDSAPGSPLSATVTIYRGDEAVPFQNLDLEAPVINTLNFPGACFPMQNYCVEQGTYTFEAQLPGAFTYHVIYQRCCGNNAVANVDNPGMTGMTIYATLVPALGGGLNSSPVPLNFLTDCTPVNEPYAASLGLTDADGDSLLYSFCAPLMGGGPDQVNATAPGGVAPNPDLPPPYQPYAFVTPHTAQQPISGTPPLAIDPATGLLSGTPDVVGRYVFGVCVSEFRNGQLLGETRFFRFLDVLAEPLDVSATDNDRQLRLFPNPVAGRPLTVDLPPSAGLYELAVTDVAGTVVRTWKGQRAGPFDLPLEGLPPGIYFLRAVSAAGEYGGKFVLVK